MRSLVAKYFRFLLCISLSLGASCHMDHDHEESHDEAHNITHGIHVEPEIVSKFGVETDTIVPHPFHHVIKTSGSIQSSSSDIITVSAKKSGIFTLSPSVTDGTLLNSGQGLGFISTDGMEGGDVNSAAMANYNAAKAEYERLKPLFEEKLITASAFREAERAYKEAEALAGGKNPSGNSAVTSPCKGYVVNLFVKSGEYVEKGAPIAVIAKNSSQMLKADLPVREAGHLIEIESANFIPEGTNTLYRLSDLSGEKVSGNAFATSENGFIPVYFSFQGTNLIQPGGFAEIFLICNAKEDVMAVPKEALVEIQGNKYVYVASGAHSYEKRLVKTGATDGEKIEITEGLTPGDVIVSKGASIIRMVEVSSVAPPSHSHTH